MYTKESHKSSLIEALDFHCTNALNAMSLFTREDSRVGYCEAALEAAKAVIGQLKALGLDAKVLKAFNKRVSTLEMSLLLK